MGFLPAAPTPECNMSCTRELEAEKPQCHQKNSFKTNQYIAVKLEDKILISLKRGKNMLSLLQKGICTAIRVCQETSKEMTKPLWDPPQANSLQKSRLIIFGILHKQVIICNRYPHPIMNRDTVSFSIRLFKLILDWRCKLGTI